MAAGRTYTPIAKTTLSTASSTVTFDSISGEYTDLVLVFNGQFNSTTKQIAVNFNGDSATNYSDTNINGDGSSASSARDTTRTAMYLGYMPTANAQLTSILQFMNYSNSTTYKTVIARSNDSAGNVSASVGLWRSTAAINSIVISAFNGGNYNIGSTFSLYGIAAA